MPIITPRLAAVLLLGTLGQAQTLWKQVYPQQSPPGRFWHDTVYDRAREVVVLFGGRSDGSSSGALADTWEWTWNAMTRTWNWQQRVLAGPSGRAAHRMAYDEARQRTVLYGGTTGSGSERDTWEYDGSSWVQRPTLTDPGGGISHVMTYDAARAETLLFGAGSGLGETWTWGGVDWTQRQPSTSPPGEVGAMTYDRARQVAVLFVAAVSQTWEWDGVTWTRRFPANSPPSGSGVMAFDEVRQRVVLFGTAGFTWEWDGTNWQIVFNAPPPPLPQPAMVYNVAHGRTVLFGGKRSGMGTADTWEYLTPVPARYVPFARGCAGTAGVPQLAAAPGELPWFGQRAFVLDLTGVPGATAWGILGGSRTSWLGMRLPLDLSGAGMSGCALAVSADVIVPLSVGCGTATFTIPFPPEPDLVGKSAYTQALVADPGANPAGLVLSTAGEMTIGAR